MGAEAVTEAVTVTVTVKELERGRHAGFGRDGFRDQTFCDIIFEKA